MRRLNFDRLNFGRQELTSFLGQRTFNLEFIESRIVVTAGLPKKLVSYLYLHPLLVFLYIALSENAHISVTVISSYWTQ
jgi:hypothetical protein